MAYAGRDFSPIDVGESEVYSFDFSKVLAAGETIISTTWTSSDQAILSIVGSPAVANGLVVSQRLTALSNGFVTLLCTVNTSLGDTQRLFAGAPVPAQTTYTATDLVTRALVDVTVARVAEAEDVTDATPYVTPFLDDLAQRRVTGPLSAYNLPSSLFPDLVRALAEHLAPRFGGRPTNGDDLVAIEGRLASLTRLDITIPALVLATLEQIDIWGKGTTTIDAPAVERRLPGLLNELSARAVIYVADMDELPEGSDTLLAQWAAARILGLDAPRMMAEQGLRALAPTQSFATVRACYF